MIPSDWLAAFAVFAEDASLSGAARRLHLSQPAVHAQLKKLQELLGVPLYRRAGRGLALTREGEEVAAFARRMDESCTELAGRLRGEQGERRIVLAAGAGAIVDVIAEGLRAFVRGWDGRLEVVTCDARAAIAAVVRGEAHAGVAALGPAAEAIDPVVEARAITEVEQALVVPKAHRLATRRAVRLRDLAGERLVVPPSGRPQRVALEAAFRQAGVELRPSATATGWDVTLRLVDLGIGLGIVNASCRTPKTLRKKPLRELPRVRYVALVRRGARADVNSLVHALVEHGGAWRERTM